jgi:hypothetical protein
MAQIDEIELGDRVKVKQWIGVVVAINDWKVKSAPNIVLVNFSGVCRWCKVEFVEVLKNHG